MVQRRRTYVRERYADDEEYYVDHTPEELDMLEMKHGEMCIGDSGLTHDEFWQAVEDLEVHGWQGCTTEPAKTTTV